MVNYIMESSLCMNRYGVIGVRIYCGWICKLVGFFGELLLFLVNLKVDSCFIR